MAKCLYCLNTGCEYCTPKEAKVSESPSLTGYEDLARKIVDNIIEDLADRRGLKHEYRQCDPDIQEEIKETWRQIVEDEMIKSL